MAYLSGDRSRRCRDPFCGGGSIPLEAQRLGLRAHGSDLNPVAVLVSKATCEIPPKFAGLPPVNPERDPHMAWKGAQGLAEDIRYYGRWMRDEARARIGHLYPKVAIDEAMAAARDDLKPYAGKELTVHRLSSGPAPSPRPTRRCAARTCNARKLLRAVVERRAGSVIVHPAVNRAEGSYRFTVKSDAASHPTMLASLRSRAPKRQGAPISYVWCREHRSRSSTSEPRALAARIGTRLMRHCC